MTGMFQSSFGQSALADLQRFLAVLGFDDLEIQAFQDAPCNFSDDARVIDNKTRFHFNFLSIGAIATRATRQARSGHDFEAAIDIGMAMFGNVHRLSDPSLQPIILPGSPSR
jgi:hypothetical protein